MKITKAHIQRIRPMMKRIRARPGKRSRLKHHDPAWTGKISGEKEAKALLEEGIKRLAKQQAMLYAQDTRALLLVFQAMDAAGKDGTIRHVMSGVNPQGCQVYSFKAPSAEERDHDFLWRSMKALPERGRIGIHNRSYYEEVLITRVHPEIMAGQQLPPELKGKDVFKRRFKQINAFERYLVENGTTVLKFFLHLSKDEQKRRFLARIEEPEKNWKFSAADSRERTHWDEYMAAYEDVFQHTSTDYAPWYIVPADHKWFTRLAVGAIIYQTLEDMDLAFPKMTPKKIAELKEARQVLLSESE